MGCFIASMTDVRQHGHPRFGEGREEVVNFRIAQGHPLEVGMELDSDDPVVLKMSEVFFDAEAGVDGADRDESASVHSADELVCPSNVTCLVRDRQCAREIY